MEKFYLRRGAGRVDFRDFAGRVMFEELTNNSPASVEVSASGTKITSTEDGPSGFAWRNAPWPPEHETITDIWPQIEIEEHAATLIQAHYRGKMVRQMPYRKQRKEQLDKELDEYMNSN